MTDPELTETNRKIVGSFVEEIFVNRRMETLGQCLDSERYTEHSPETYVADKALAMKYDRVHRILAEGNFVLTTCEGADGGVHFSFYDLFRVAEGKIVEHWDTVEAIPPRSEWKNDNGKF